MPAPDETAFLLVVLEVHGSDIQPFGYDDRVDFLVALDDSIVHINLSNIELLAVEEFLPAAGPAAESLLNLYGTNGVMGKPPPKPQAEAPSGNAAAQTLSSPQTRAAGRKLLQYSTRGSYSDASVVTPSANVSEPIVRVTLRISTTAKNLPIVVSELQASVANSTASFVEGFRSKGHNVSTIFIDSITPSYAPIGGPSLAPALPNQPGEASSAASLSPSISTANRSGGRVFVQPTTQDASTKATTIGVSVGIGVLLLVSVVAAAVVIIYRRQRAEIKQGVEAAQSRHWGGPEEALPGPGGFLAPPKGLQAPDYFDNPQGPRDRAAGLFSIREDAQEVQRNASNYSTTSRDCLLPNGTAHAGEGSPQHRAEGSSHGLDSGLPDEHYSGEQGPEPRTGASPGSLGSSGRSESWGPGGELVSISDLQFSRLIGEGSFGRVYLGKWRETTVAIKLLSQPLMPGQLRMGEDAALGPSLQRSKSAKSSSVLDELRKETQIMSVLRHPNIVMFLGACSQPPCMVTEYCARGSLLDILTRAREYPAAAAELAWLRRLNMALEAAKGMLYLHSRVDVVLHRDLKSANLLVDKHWRVKVADFNLSRVMHASAVVSSVSATNPRWMAPEVLAGKRYDCAADVYSFGIILWELLTWQIPWEDLGPWQVVILVVDQQQRPDIPQDLASLPGSSLRCPDAYVELMQQCWATDPAERPSFERVISHLRSIIEAESQLRLTSLPAKEQEQEGAAKP
ncbi:g13517 [Coccomyxa viridis]|uniref:G13517 protein n=1 Tax=Coccomyxa viridis TaxID=1274662 RepID=A0ABP1GHM9_9CHLO